MHDMIWMTGDWCVPGSTILTVPYEKDIYLPGIDIVQQFPNQPKVWDSIRKVNS